MAALALLLLAGGCGMRTRVITPDSEGYDSIPLFAQCLIEAYPEEIVGYADSLTLQDAAGHEVLSTHIPAGQTTVTLSLSHLPSGSYYATLHHPDGTATQKIVLK